MSDEGYGMGEQNLWLLREDVETCNQILTAIDFDISNRVRNINDVMAAFVGVIKTKPFTVPADLPLPEGFIRPEVWLPPLDFSPDYFSLAGLTFVSRRFRDALAQPEGVVQYWPIHLARGSEEARAQDYMLFRILAWQPALDWGCSVCEREEFINPRTGEHLVAARSIKRFVPLDDLVPRTEIFRAAEARTSILVTDGLAERVLRAGCTGASFREPQTIGLLGREPQRFRTADGIGVKRPE